MHACYYHCYLHLCYSAGYIAAYSVLASGDVDLCLVPEVEVILHGPTVSSCTCKASTLIHNACCRMYRSCLAVGATEQTLLLATALYGTHTLLTALTSAILAATAILLLDAQQHDANNRDAYHT